MDPAVFFEMLVPVYQTTWYYMLEDLVFYFRIGSCLNELVSITALLFVVRHELIMMCSNSSIFFVAL
jgi:hypothetical protein